MTAVASRTIDVHVGDVSGSQLVIGDHNTIQTPKGLRVTVLQVEERPVPRLRPLPLKHRPATRPDLLGRGAELLLAAAASADSPVEIYGPDGIGKTMLLKAASCGPVDPPEGVVFETARRRTLDEVLLSLYTACWECEVPFVPTPTQVGGFLVDRQVFVVLDDCELDRDDLDVLLDTAPCCRFVIGSTERTLWSRGQVRRLEGLDAQAGVQLLERYLGPLHDDRDREAGVRLVALLEGHPQRLVEAAALVASGRASLQDLADGDASRLARLETDTLSTSERHILVLLGLLDGATLTANHISEIAALPDAASQLTELERRGWVVSASPRYRAARPLPSPDAELLAGPLTVGLLEHLTRFAHDTHEPSAVAAESEAIEAALALAARSGRWREALALALASETQLARAGAWICWRRVLLVGLDAARAVRDAAAEAHMQHQLGSLALCLGASQDAAARLHEALRIRERLEDDAGAELTRHNLRQLEPHGPGYPGNGQPPERPRWRRPMVALGMLAVLAAVVVAVLLLTHAGSATGQPTIVVSDPADGASYQAGSVVHARYACTAATRSRLTACHGTIPNGGVLDTSPGIHTFVVAARDDKGRTATVRMTYHATARQTTTAPSKHTPIAPSRRTDTTPPRVVITVPTADGQYPQGPVVRADYSCSDESGGSGLATCRGPVASGQPIDIVTTGLHKFRVTATDHAGNRYIQTITYMVTPGITTLPPTRPKINIATPLNTGQYAQNSVVTADYTCRDRSGSGLASCRGPVANGQPFDTSSLGQHDFTVTAIDNVGNKTIENATYTVTSTDTAPPSIRIGSPRRGATYPQHSLVTARFSCWDRSGGSGLATCVGTVPAGQPIDTSSVGQHSFVVNASDNAGNTFSQTVTYDVVLG